MVSEKPQKVAVLMGGRSSEREISIKTGKQISQALRGEGYEVKEIDPAGALVKDLKDFQPDVVFIALHGKYGEDGTIQGLLELLGFPYTGPGVLSSALCMDKVIAKKVMCYEGIPTPSFQVITEQLDDGAMENLIKELGLPLVVKPSKQGSAIGVSIVRKTGELEKALTEALKYDQAVLVEEYIDGTELTAAVLGTKNPRVLPLIEIVSETEFYDFTAKYSPGMSHHIIPARISPEAARKVEELALRTYRAMDCRQLSRVDFMLNSEGEPFVLETNTIPGMTETSLFPESAKAAGISFTELVSLLADEAFELFKEGDA
ncbi:D-alanine--D-alanine ligase family protein [Syntrophaceticus schinkii]|uniref:D-alanine--D-alanine ligase n=1 Tax=Syntrophaceticus schinkii TaxID=499207 RepID=A0A0B7MQG1_9FIRM|nr:D-alanine--D-alanine ligase [Syntrophaceticus schinkii]MDD2359072.1 D-alanine--D-alanine ligase [Syntrophaceticus schinkii]MDD4261819.1 D-alanine--D-alanine ligase [Syntrophaceticus schinkii]MDD4674351.1 D-alanine--D-alanine ligase [Syntrophaceticus schinkii]CEO89942.1 D-alanine--D-alanine ligase [Syntrophaceticus schinkii]